MNSLRDFKYLIAVADTLHFGKAAEQCHVSQPTLSGQLKKMEVLLGFKIFERTNKRVIITSKGELMIKAARDVVKSHQSFRQLGKSISDPESGEIHLGLIPTLAPYLLPKIMSSLTKKLDKIDFFLYEHQTKTLLEMLSSGKLDALILPWLPEMESFKCINIFDEPLLLGMHPEHALINKGKLQLSDLKQQKILTLQDGHCLKEQTNDYCFAAGAIEDEHFSATSLETLRYMIAAGAGVTLFPELATLNRNQGEVVFRHFAHPQPSRQIVLLHRSSHSRSDLFKQIVTIIKQVI